MNDRFWLLTNLILFRLNVGGGSKKKHKILINYKLNWTIGDAWKLILILLINNNNNNKKIPTMFAWSIVRLILIKFEFFFCKNKIAHKSINHNLNDWITGKTKTHKTKKKKKSLSIHTNEIKMNSNETHLKIIFSGNCWISLDA